MGCRHPGFPADEKGIASRDLSGQVLNALAKNIPWLLGGAADLAPSTKTRLTFDGAGDSSRASETGATSTSAFARTRRPRCERPRPLEAPPVLVGLPHLLRLRAGHHPAVGADGDPRRPHLHARLDRGGRGRPDPPAGRATRVAPGDSGLLVFRPADANEVAETWRYVAQHRREPAVLALSRQALPTLDRSAMAPASEVAKGAYVLVDADDELDVILIATGSRSVSRSPRVRSSPEQASGRASSACRAPSSSTGSRRRTATRCCRPR